MSKEIWSNMSDLDKSSEILSNRLRVSVQEGSEKFVIELPSKLGLLRTPAGHLVESDKFTLMLHVIRELEEFPVLKLINNAVEHPRELCSYLIFSTERDFVLEDERFGIDDIEHRLSHDPIFDRAAGPECVDQMRAWERAYPHKLTSFQSESLSVNMAQ